MKDPLYEKETPYEILGVSVNADMKAVNDAFKKALISRRDRNELTEAKNTLNRPVERAFVDIFLYSEPFIGQLAPRVAGNSSQLIDRRSEVAEAWSNIHKRLFPHYASAHSLGLLWYWWAIYCEEEQWASLNKTPFNNKGNVSVKQGTHGSPFHFRSFNQIVGEAHSLVELTSTIERLCVKDPNSVSYHLKEGHIQSWLKDVLHESSLADKLTGVTDPAAAHSILEKHLASILSLDNIWSNVIAHWAFLINSSDFWANWNQTKGRTGVSLNSDDIEALRQRLESHFINLFHTFAERYRIIKETELVKKYKRYELLFTTEMQTAKQLVKSGVKYSRNNGKFAVCCGRLMLEQVGILEEIQKQLPDPSILSKHKNIAVLVENKKYDEAIATINALPPQERKSKEVLQLTAMAYLEKGKHHFSINKFEDAFVLWREGFATGEVSEELKQTIVTSCQTKAVSLQKSDPSSAITILERALELIKSDKNLSLTLGEMLTDKGIEVINEAQKKIEAEGKGVTDEIKAAIRQGVSLLERASRLGSKRAAENWEKAKEIIEQMDSPFWGMPPEIAKVLSQANEAANKKKWDEAINILRAALKTCRDSAQAIFKQMLAQFLNARAVDSINIVMTMSDQIKQNKIDKFIKTGVVDDVKQWFEVGETQNQKSIKKWIKNNSGVILYLAVLFVLVIGVVLLGHYNKKYEKDVGTIVGYLFFFFIVIIPQVIIPFFSWLHKTFKDIFVTMPNFNAYGNRYDNRPPCRFQSCSDRASYTFNLSGHGECLLCDSHATLLRTIIEMPDPLMMSSLKKSEADLEEALKLDPNLGQVKENLKQVREIQSRFRATK